MEDQPMTNAQTQPTVVDQKTKLLSLDKNVAGLICYCPLFGLNVISSIAFLATEPQDRQFVRFHSMQSLILFFSVVALFFISTVGSIILGFIPVIGAIISVISGLAIFAYSVAAFFATIFLMFKAYSNESTRLPLIGDIALKYSQESTSHQI